MKQSEPIPYDAHPTRVDTPLLSRLLKTTPSRNVAFFIVVASVLLVCAIGSLDFATGPEFRFSLYYSLPLLFVTWFVGRKMGYAMALVTAGVWLVAELNGAARYTHLSHAVFNTITRLLVLLATSFMLSSFKELSSRLAELVDQRTRALRDLSIRLSHAEESERSRLAHDVHDGLGQVLTLLKLNLGNAINDYSKLPAPTQKLEELLAMVSDLIDHCRTLTFELHPTMLETLGLVPTLRQYAEQFSRQTQVEVTVSEMGKCGRPPGVLVGYLFRSAKELLTNAVKHGHAREIVVSVFWNDRDVRVMVDDDGAGFDPASLAPGAGKAGIGLAGIRERIQSLQGALTVESVVGGGTRVILEIPFDKSEQL